MDEPEELYKAAVKAINDLFGDDSVAQSTTRKSLRGLRDEIDLLLDTLDSADEGE